MSLTIVHPTDLTDAQRQQVREQLIGLFPLSGDQITTELAELGLPPAAITSIKELVALALDAAINAFFAGKTQTEIVASLEAVFADLDVAFVTDASAALKGAQEALAAL